MPAPQRQAPTSGCAALAASASLEAARAGRLLVDPMPFSHLGCALQTHQQSRSIFPLGVAHHRPTGALREACKTSEAKPHSTLCTLAKNSTFTLFLRHPANA